MDKFTGVIQSMEIVEISGSKGAHYPLVIKINTLNYYLGVQYLSEAQSRNSKLIDSLKIGSRYTFFVNPTYSISNGLNSGVSRIEANNKVIFEKSEHIGLLLGSLLTLLSLLAVVFIRKIYRNLSVNE